MECILRDYCSLYKSKSCTPLCQAHIALYGVNSKDGGGRVQSANIPLEYQDLTVNWLPLKESEPEVYRLIKLYSDSFSRMFKQDDNVSRIKNLYLYSENTGNGKTSSACSLLLDYLAKHIILASKEGRKLHKDIIYFLDVNHLQTLYNMFNRNGVSREVAENASREYYRQLNMAKVADLVVFDDIGVRSATDGFRGDIHMAINERIVNKRICIFTSNLPIEEMANVFEKRLYDRMRDMTVNIVYKGESKRGRRG